LVIGAGNLALEHAVQRFREQPNFYNLSAAAMEQQITGAWTNAASGCSSPRN
ncbi:hypothetical protein G3435_17110, partial [Pseudomonas sp. MAFF212428]|nr:hypothetical protein [Pseudomonas brassicae]